MVVARVVRFNEQAAARGHVAKPIFECNRSRMSVIWLDCFGLFCHSFGIGRVRYPKSRELVREGKKETERERTVSG